MNNIQITRNCFVTVPSLQWQLCNADTTA